MAMKAPCTESALAGRDSVADARNLLNEAERQAERLATLVRIATSVSLIGLAWLMGRTLGESDPTLLRQAEFALFTLYAWLGFALVAYGEQHMGANVTHVAIASVTADALVVFAHLHYGLNAVASAHDAVFLFPAMWIIPLLQATVCLRWKPVLQLYATALYGVGIAFTIMVQPSGGDIAAQDLERVAFLFGPIPDGVRYAALALFSCVLVLGARRGQLIVMKVAAETERRWVLSRYLPAEIVPILTQGGARRLTQGTKRHVAAMFVDLRDSTGISQKLDSEEMAELIGEYRSVILEQASRHGGILDKFIGDGALVVFGAIEADDNPARGAIACSVDLARALALWTQSVPFKADQPLQFGIGVHFGTSFVGIVGDANRLEFTVIGETPNIAAKLEKAAARSDHRVLISKATFDAALLRGGDYGFEPVDVAIQTRDGSPFEVLGFTALSGR